MIRMQIIGSEIKELQSLISELVKTSKTLDEKFVALVVVAEKKKDINLITEANALKRKSEEKVEERRKLEEGLKILIKKKKYLNF